MKKILFSIMALLAIAGTSRAQTNALSVADIELPQNGEAELVINFQLDAPDTYTAYSFNIDVSSDLSFEMDTETGPTDVFYIQGDVYHKSHGVTANLSEGLVKVACLSTGSIPLTKQSGELLTFILKAGNLEVGKTYTGTIKDILFTPVEGEKKSLDDVTFTIKIIENDGRIKFNENSTKLPKYTAGEKYNVTMVRTIKAGQWSTICLPFNMTKTDAETVFGNDVQVKTYKGYTAVIDETTLIPSEITVNFETYTMSSLKPLKAGTPYLIKTSKNVESFDVDNVTLVAETNDVTGNETNYELDGKFKGVLAKTTVPNKGLFISDNKFYYSTGNTTIKAFRGWFNLQAVYNEAVVVEAPVFFSFDGNGETTGIKNVQQTTGDNKYYNLSGQSVENPGKGLYIQNGKKVIIK